MTDALTLKNLSFRALFDAAADAMLLVDNSGHIVLANPAAQLLFGYTEDELCGLTVEALIPPQYRKQHRHYRELFSGKPEQRSMGNGKGLVALSRDGKEMILDIGLSPIKELEQFYTLVIFNIADRRHAAEQALQVSEERLHLAKQAANLGIFDYDCKRKIIYWDEQMCQLWGDGSDKTVTYKEFMAVIHPEDHAVRQAAYNHAINPANNGEYIIEFRVIHPISGVVHWIAAVGRVHFEDGHANRLVGIARDVTKQKNFEKNLQVQRAEAKTLFKEQGKSVV